MFLLRGVVEYDAEGFTKLTLLLMWKDFCFLVHSEYTFAMCIHLGIFYYNNQGETMFSHGPFILACIYLFILRS